MDVVDYIVKKYEIDISKKSPFTLNFNRITDLPILFRELGYKVGAEIGVCEGRFSEILCRELPETLIYSIDAWKFYPLYKNFRRPEHYPPIYESAVEKLSKYSNSRIIRAWSLDAVKCFEDNSLDFVFIDADHRFQAITNDIAEWGRKVKIGGIISGHDFARSARVDSRYCVVKDVVCAWTYAHGIHPWFILDYPLERSWMWVKTKEMP